MRKTTFGLAGIFVLLWSLFGVPAMLHAAEPAQYAPGEALVVLKNRIGQVSAAALSSASGGNYVKSVAESAGAKVATTYAALSEARNEIFVLIKSETKSTEELLAELAKNPDVECASPNYRVQAFTTTPNDPDYGSLWGLEKIRVSEVWDTTTGSENVHVAVIDTGLYAGHPDLAANVETSLSRSFVNPDNSVTPVVSSNFSDRDGHGTHVAGTIAAVGNNEIGVVGVNWRAKIIALKALRDNGSGWDSWTIAALDYLVDLLRANPDMRIPAVNLSLGGWIPETPAVRQNSATWRAYKALDDTNRTVIVVAAGNEGHEVGAPAPADYYNQRGERIVTKGAYCYPASFTGLKNLLVVGSVNVSDTAPAFTNWSSGSVHLAAPGVNIRSTYSAEALTGASLYANLQGTSMSAPHVAGAVALLASAHADRTANQLKELLCNSAN
ncbi:MAG: S8 family serine peptidase, partial [Synergistaceae bacterium]|nr:S8 family serine peptidase [Synergistaceae bacterium]